VFEIIGFMMSEEIKRRLENAEREVVRQLGSKGANYGPYRGALGVFISISE